MYFDQCPATQECHAADTGHDTRPVTVCRHRADLPLCYPMLSKDTLEYTTSPFNVLGHTRSGNPSLTFHTPANAQLFAASCAKCMEHGCPILSVCICTKLFSGISSFQHTPCGGLQFNFP